MLIRCVFILEEEGGSGSRGVWPLVSVVSFRVGSFRVRVGLGSVGFEGREGLGELEGLDRRRGSRRRRRG